MLPFFRRCCAIGPAHLPTDLGLLFLRLWFGGAMLLAHGLGKVPRLAADPIQFGDPIGVGPVLSLLLVIGAEVGCAALVLVGCATRIAAVPLIITMFVAGFIVHGHEGFQRMELALTYMAAYIALLAAGSGRFSVDAWLTKPRIMP